MIIFDTQSTTVKNGERPLSRKDNISQNRRPKILFYLAKLFLSEIFF
jgi:hypothetical protein